MKTPVLIATPAPTMQKALIAPTTGPSQRRPRPRFGARFDMEADSVLAIALSIYVAHAIGWWAVAIGLFRYAFALAALAAPWLNAQLPPRMSRKVVAASQGAILVRWLT